MRIVLSYGRSLGYLVAGQGPMIILLHPVGLNAHFWDSVTEYLRGDYRIIAVDCPGHGDSDVPLAFLSMGGILAQGVAARRPDLVRGVVISNAGHISDDASRAALRQRSKRALAGMPTILDDTISRWFSDAFRAKHPEIVKQASDMLLSGDLVVHSWTWEAMVELNYGLYLNRLPMPVIALTGSEDRSVSLAAFQALTDTLPHPKSHIFSGAGHLPPLETPKDYARVLDEFSAAAFKDTRKQQERSL